MNRRLWAVAALVAVSACYSWDKDLEKCVSNNRCESPNPDGGAGGGGDIDSGMGGGAVGGGGGGGVGGGGGDDGGISYGDAGTFALACMSDGFCWENPFPFGANLRAVNSIAPGDAWAVGEGGAAVHVDAVNDAFTPLMVPATMAGQADYALIAVVATPTGVFATDQLANALRLDTSPVKRAAILGGSGHGYALWDSPTGSPWLAGDVGPAALIATLDPNTLATNAIFTAQGPGLVSFDGTASQQYAVALDGTVVLGSVDAGFSLATVGGIGVANDVAVLNDTSAFFCGDQGVALFPAVDGGTDGGADGGLDAGTDAGVDAGFDAGTNVPCRANAVAAPLAFSVPLASPQIVTWNVSPLRFERSTALPFAANDLSVQGAVVVLAGDDGHLATFNSDLERVTDLSPGSRADVADVWVDSDGGGVAVTGGGQVLKRVARAWKAFDAGVPLTAIEKLSDGVYLVGTASGAGVLTASGLTTSAIATGGLKRISVGQSGAWAVNGSGQIFQLDAGQVWSEAFTASNTQFNAIWAAPDGPVFAVGGTVASDGGTELSAWKFTVAAGWAQVATGGLPGPATDVSGTSSSDVWIVGGTGDTFQWAHLDPLTSGSQQGPAPIASIAITSIAPGEAWVSTGSWHAHGSGGVWQVIPAGIARAPLRLRHQAGAVWLVGERGTLLRMPR